MMFSIQSATLADSRNYDFTKDENASKWRGLFATSLCLVLKKLHPTLQADDDALLYVESLCLHLLGLLCAKPSPQTIEDIADRVSKTFPNSFDNLVLNGAYEIIDKSKKSKKFVFPVEKIHRLLCKEVLQERIDPSVSTFIVAVMEYMSTDILLLVGNYVKKIPQVDILRDDIKIAMCADQALMDLFIQESTTQIFALPSTPRDARNCLELVKGLINEEKQYQRELQMIILVFYKEMAKMVEDPDELKPIFANINDIYELTEKLLCSLEDVNEMEQEEVAPYVGDMFQEMAEGQEFDVYFDYARAITSSASRDTLQNMLNLYDFSTTCQGFREAVKYYLPKLLLGPIWHVFSYLQFIKALLRLNQKSEYSESFKQVQDTLKPAFAELPKDCRIHSTLTRRQLAIEKVKELQDTVDLMDKNLPGSYCYEFIRSDTLQISTKRMTERKVYLFDGMMLMCRNNARRQTIPSIVPNRFAYRQKEKKFEMRHVAVIDLEDTGGLTHAFKIEPRDGRTSTVMVAKSAQHKNEWMADLVMVTTKSNLERRLDSILLSIEKKYPLRTPSPEQYKFAEPDTPDNIVLEKRDSATTPRIKGATLCKLIERLTYHIYPDPMFMRTFLITFRSFCSPCELLTLLFERFKIPDPSVVFEDEQLTTTDLDVQKNLQPNQWIRYNKKFVQPVQFRVLNVLYHWVDKHFYDFVNDPELLAQLLEFLNSVSGKSTQKSAKSLQEKVYREKDLVSKNKQINIPAPIGSHFKVHYSAMTLLTLHPMVLAQQLTLLAFDMYKMVQPSELLGTVWTTSSSQMCSPNLCRISKHTTNITRWVEKTILEAENFDERVAVFTRAIEVMNVLLELNNFNSVISIACALSSNAVNRLHFTKAAISARHRNILDECCNLNQDHDRRYLEKLRSINPPCVPFMGTYQTRIFHLEQGNKDFLDNTKLINFYKRRRVAETIDEIQQYQNLPYSLKVVPLIRDFLETINPYEGLPDDTIQDQAWNLSIRIEPKDVRTLPKFPRLWPELDLKSPSIKRRSQNKTSQNHLPSSTASTASTTTPNKSTATASLCQLEARAETVEEPPPLRPRVPLRDAVVAQHRQTDVAPILPLRDHSSPPVLPRRSVRNVIAAHARSLSAHFNYYNHHTQINQQTKSPNG